jgi:phosphoenolpyruvate carboxylase
LQKLYHNWSFFKNLIDNLQMALAKVDLNIAKEYTKLVNDEKVVSNIFNMIEQECIKTKELVLQITDQHELLENVPAIKESIKLRNPYVDPLSYIQIKLISDLRNLRMQGKEDSVLLEQVLLTINGIAAGLRNTG